MAYKNEKAEEFFDRYPPRTLARFKEFHRENPSVYHEFKKLAHEMKSAGVRKYSAQAIIYVLRWHRDLQTGGDVFQINNDFTSIYARLMIYDQPEFKDFFEIRDMPCKGQKSEEQLKRERIKYG